MRRIGLVLPRLLVGLILLLVLSRLLYILNNLGIDLYTVHMPWVDHGVQGDQFFRQTNDSIAKTSQKEGGLHSRICSGWRYWLRYGGRKIGGLSS